MEDAERVQKDILHFLDLQQKEENIRESQKNVRQALSLNRQALFAAKQVMSTQEQADATDAQNQILFIFTIVTIVFLPLSFITSYYGMNAKNEKGEQILQKPSYLNKVLFAISGSITAFLSLGGLIWFFGSKESAEKNRIKELARLKMKMNGDLPLHLLEAKLAEKVNKMVSLRTLVRRTLHAALKELRSENPVVVWLSALCMEQSAMQRRGEWTLRLRDIYKSAEEVVVWLGRGDEKRSRPCAF